MKPLLILYLRTLAFLLDLIGRKHSIRRRLGQLLRKPRQTKPAGRPVEFLDDPP